MLTVGALGLAGCAAEAREVQPPRAPQAPPPEVVVAPAEWATDDALPFDLDAAVRRGFAGARVAVLDARSALAQREPSCATDPACVELVARELGAEKLLRTRLATLGGTVLLRFGVIDLATGTRAEERQEVVSEASAERLGAAVEALARQVAAPYRPPPPSPPLPPAASWYEQWWVWTLIGAAVVGTGVGVGVGVAAQPEGPDVVVTPP